MEMPGVNIFIIAAPPQKKEKKERKLTSALREKKNSDNMMVSKLSEISEKLKRLPMTSHLGGG